MPDKDHEKFLLWLFISGLGVILFITLWVSGALTVPSGVGWFYAYQTAIFGIIAASITWHQYQDTLYRKRLSERAKMNDALSYICTYTRACFWAVKDDEHTNILPQPMEYIDTLKASIEFLDKDTSESVFELVSFYQIHNARLENLLYHNETPVNGAKTDALYDAVRLYALAVRLFEYARNEVSSIKNSKLSLQHMHSALNGVYGFTKKKIACWDSDITPVVEKIEREHS